MSDDESLDEGADAAAELAAEKKIALGNMHDFELLIGSLAYVSIAGTELEKDEEAELSRTDRNRKKEKRDKVRREAQALRDARTRRRERSGGGRVHIDAVTVPDVDSLEEALEKARACGMEWTDSDGNLCHTTQVRDALRAFKPLRQLEDLEEVGRKLEEGLADMPVRTVPLGEDAERRRYWVFPADFSRLYVEGDDVLGSIAQQQVPLGLTSPSSRPLAQARPWGYLESVQEVRELIASLDARGTRERDLKTRLRKATFARCCIPQPACQCLLPNIHCPMSVAYGPLPRSPNAHRLRGVMQQAMLSLPPCLLSPPPPCRYMGVFKQSMLAVPSFTLPTADAESTGADAGWTTDGPHVGARVLRTFDDVAQLATVVRYLPPDASANDPALWHLAHDDGDEEDFDEAELTPVLEAYSNRFAKSRVTKSQLGLDGMRAEFSALEAVLAPALKKRGATWAHAHEADGSSPRKDFLLIYNLLLVES
ncbi:hypothetical protein T492DRAFT_843382 [Pavlovales sp. CCMP2436]|nr:hypothetical protein T492DRAFT_843382 [Pavlovales sp. CCMP2436]